MVIGTPFQTMIIFPNMSEKVHYNVYIHFALWRPYNHLAQEYDLRNHFWKPKTLTEAFRIKIFFNTYNVFCIVQTQLIMLSISFEFYIHSALQSIGIMIMSEDSSLKISSHNPQAVAKLYEILIQLLE
jgi:hypothetical protein